MLSQDKPRRDAFTFSLGGMTVFGGFTGFPAIADDRMKKSCEQQKTAPEANCEPKTRRPLWRRRRTTA